MRSFLFTAAIYFIWHCTAYSQISSTMENETGWIEVVYQFRLPKKNKTVQLPAHTIEMTQKVDRLVENMDFKLLCSRTRSKFTTQYTFDDNDFAEKIAAAIVDGNSTFFVDATAKISLIEKKELGEILLFIDDSQLSWEITDTTAEINGLPCRYATGTIKTPGFSDQIVTAWFTSAYPLPFGPRNLHGLPGLIVQGQIGKMTYTATSIRNIRDQQQRIIIPRWDENTMRSTNYYEKLKEIVPSPPKRGGG